jgi:hypothetical protein
MAAVLWTIVSAGLAPASAGGMLQSDVAGRGGPISQTIAAGDPLSRTSHLAYRKPKAYLMTVSASRGIVARVRSPGDRPGQLVWLAVLLASMCGLALFLGRQFGDARASPGWHRSRRRV